MTLAVLFASIGAGFGLASRQAEILASGETAAPANPTGATSPFATPIEGLSTAMIFFALAFLALIAAVIIFFIGHGWSNLLKERSFDLLILLGTFVLPMLIAFPIKLLESRLNVAIPTDAASVAALTQRDLMFIGGFVVLFFAIAIAIGMIWNRDWWKYGALFWSVYVILYTTIFTNAAGFFTGIVGSLGYWLVQQGVERGSQPEYYYVLSTDSNPHV